MEELKNRHAQFLQAFERLRYMATEFEKIIAPSGTHTDKEENELVLHRDALIQRFSFCYELMWKFLKTLLRDHYDIEVANPRVTFQESLLQKIITEEESQILLKMAQSRNEMAHVYDEERAIAVSKRILIYARTLITLSEKLKNFVQ